eukprot:Amastigsp_a508890_169.p2 type:complete len:119 gc:universal Amastigsp_a508890_169:436-792(+)
MKVMRSASHAPLSTTAAAQRYVEPAHWHTALLPQVSSKGPGVHSMPTTLAQTRVSGKRTGSSLKRSPEAPTQRSPDSHDASPSGHDWPARRVCQYMAHFLTPFTDTQCLDSQLRSEVQ